MKSKYLTKQTKSSEESGTAACLCLEHLRD